MSKIDSRLIALILVRSKPRQKKLTFEEPCQSLESEIRRMIQLNLFRRLIDDFHSSQRVLAAHNSGLFVSTIFRVADFDPVAFHLDPEVYGLDLGAGLDLGLFHVDFVILLVALVSSGFSGVKADESRRKLWFLEVDYNCHDRAQSVEWPKDPPY